MTPNAFVNRLLVSLGEPNSPDPEAFFAEYHRILRGYSASVVALASDLVIDAETFWPRPAELRKHLNTASARLHPRKPEPPEPELPERSEAERARAQALLDGLKARLGEKLTISDERVVPADVSRSEFRAMQASSPNHHLHRRQS